MNSSGLGAPLEEPIEVCLVMRHFYPILAGAAERFRRYSGPLAERGIRFRVFTLRESDEHATEEELENGLHVTRISAEGIPWARDAALFRAAFEYLRTAPRGSRVLQTSLAHKLARPWLARIRRLGVPCLYVGTMVGKKEPGLSAVRRVINTVREWSNYTPFSAVVASTTVMKEWQQRLGVPKRRIRVIPNGVDTTRFSPPGTEEKANLRAAFDLPPGEPIVLFAGSIVPRKGVELLLQAWAQVKKSAGNGQLILAGGFERPTFMTKERMQELGQFQDRMKALAASGSMRKSVRFIGEIDNIEDWMKASDVFVFPSEQEGMGNVVLEAMACALPCVITRFHGLPLSEFGIDGRENLLVERTPEALAVGVMELFVNGDQAQAIGDRARDWAVAACDLRATIDRYARLYQELATG